MKTLPSTPSIALDSCVPAKPSLDTLGCAPVFVSPAKSGLGHLVTGSAQIGLIDLLARAQSRFSKLLLQQYAHHQSPVAAVWTRSLTVLFPYLEQRQG
jgi:hypothetical protein